MKLQVLLNIILVTGLAACVNNKKDAPVPVSACDPAQATFSAHVNPIIQQNCAISGCHISGFSDGDFTQYADLKEKADNGTFKNSVIDGHAPVMPPSGQLPKAQLRVLQCWLENGAPNN